MKYDCLIIGGGPAGLNAALVLGRARKQVLVIDNNQARNQVTGESHGFITRDGTRPADLKALGLAELTKYPSITVVSSQVVQVTQIDGGFKLLDEAGNAYLARKVIVATGFQDKLPSIPQIADYYGKSLFSCPFCDGWELQDQVLAVIAENPRALHFTQTISNWSEDIALFTNGQILLSEAEKERLLVTHNIPVYEEKINRLLGENGRLTGIELADGRLIPRSGGFIASEMTQVTSFLDSLTYDLNAKGGIKVDELGRSSLPGLFACGDVTTEGLSQVVIAAAAGSKAAIAVTAELTAEKFH